MPHRLPRALLSGGLIVVLGLASFAIWHFTRSEPPIPPDDWQLPQPDLPTDDPRLVFNTPFRNVKPGVRYVGDDACAKCHQDISKSFHAHPMGRSAATVAQATPIEKHQPSGHTSFSSGIFDLKVEQSPAGVRHRVHVREATPAPVADFVIPAEIAIGSGTRGRSYLCVEQGAVWETPVSWFGPDQRWDVSPGFHLGSVARRAILPACLYCHVDRVEPIPGADNRYREPLFSHQVAIGCERCHGPAEHHIRERTAGSAPKLDTSIVNPRHLSPVLQLAICEQCHLQGEDRVNRRGRDQFEYRPGLPFEQFASVYVRHPEIASANRSVGQFEQMEQSRCFTGSGGKMVCTSCHNPHSVPELKSRDAFYRQRCLTCHTSNGCSLSETKRQVKNDSCIACHMPRAASSNIIHASVTDHSVPRAPTPHPVAKGLTFGTPPLVRFRRSPFTPSPDELDRDLGIVLAGLVKRRVPEEMAAGGDFATKRLQSSLARWPGDAEAWKAFASVQDDAGESFRAARNAVSLAPESESALAALVESATNAGRFDMAEEAAGKWIRMSPTSIDPLLSRAVVNLTRGDWDKAEAAARAVLRLQPLHPQAHLYLGICLHKRGDSTAGLQELQTALQLESDTREKTSLREWFRRATR